MCGIVGYIAKDINKANFLNGLAKIKYRGPDNTGFYQHNDVMLGHNRLSIIDLEERSNQPFITEDNRWVIVFNGEIYNYKKLRVELESLGLKFRTESDTEVVLNAYIAWREKSFIKLHGMFALAIYDRVENIIILTRDRFGEKPLFYFFDNARFLFSSELKCIKDIIGQIELNSDGLIDYLSYGYIPCPKTVYSSTFKLEPGSYVVLDCDQIKIRRKEPYFTLDFWSNIQNVSLDDRLQSFEEILRNTAEEMSYSDVVYGAFLSGGVDSSGAIAFLKKINPNIQAFTIGFEEKQFDETKFATIVAKHLELNHLVQVVKMEDVADIYDQMVYLYDEPFNDFSFIPTFYVCQAARKHATMVISGDGADEIFCGYRKYHRLKGLGQLKAYGPLANMLSYSSFFLPESSDLKRQLFRMGLDCTELLNDMMAIVFKERELKKILGGEYTNIARNRQGDSVVNKHLSNIPTDLSLVQKLRYLDIKMTLADDMLVKVDRASMYNSLEVRAFYLHPQITDFAFSLPENLLTSSKISKVFLKKAFEKYLPREILYREKMGFGIPLNQWLFKDLKFLLEDSLRVIPDEIINKSYFRSVLDNHMKGNRDFVMQIHSIVFLAQWLKKNNFV